MAKITGAKSVLKPKSRWEGGFGGRGGEPDDFMNVLHNILLQRSALSGMGSEGSGSGNFSSGNLNERSLFLQ